MSVLSKELELKIVSEDSVTCNVVIVCRGQGKLDYHTPILGTPMCQWVAQAFAGYNIEYVDEYDDYISIAKSHCNGYTYTIVIGGNMPMLTVDNVSALVEYGVFKCSNYVKFTGGIMVRGEYICGVDSPFCDAVYTGDYDNFYTVDNKVILGKVAKMLQGRIIEYHINNGVNILGKVTIEPSVDIEPGAEIYAGNVIKGNTYIGKGVILKENNVIDSSVIGDGSYVSYSVLDKVKLGNNCIVPPFSNLHDTIIPDNTTIRSNQ